MEFGLKEGIQTKITPLVRKEVKKIKGKDLGFVINAIKYIHANYKFSKRKPKSIPKRVRTAEELIKSKIMTGCTDFVHLFLAFCRAKKIPALYVETFNKDWLKKPSENIRGHVYSKIKIRNTKYIVDPTIGSINVLPRYERSYKEMCEGLDFKTIFPTRREYVRRIKKHFKIEF